MVSNNVINLIFINLLTYQLTNSLNFYDFLFWKYCNKIYFIEEKKLFLILNFPWKLQYFYTHVLNFFSFIHLLKTLKVIRDQRYDNILNIKNSVSVFCRLTQTMYVLTLWNTDSAVVFQTTPPVIVPARIKRLNEPKTCHIIITISSLVSILA